MQDIYAVKVIPFSLKQYLGIIDSSVLIQAVQSMCSVSKCTFIPNSWVETVHDVFRIVAFDLFQNNNLS